MVQHRLPMLPSAGEVPWVESVNGTEKKLNIENNAILLDYLRQAGSLGQGCDIRTCGCCSVLIDGEQDFLVPLYREADGCKITTVEGLADAIIFTNPGNVCTIRWLSMWFVHLDFGCCFFLLENNLVLTMRKKLQSEEFVQCTGYQQIVDSIKAASDSNFRRDYRRFV